MSYPNRKSKKAPEVQSDEPELFEKVVHINRCAKVVKGGRRFSFAALVVVGDQNGKVGFGYGKAQMVPDAIRKGTDQAKKAMKSVAVYGDTIPHTILGNFDGGKVLLKPARQGTGIIAGGGVRAVVEAAGVKNILSKSLGIEQSIVSCFCYYKWFISIEDCSNNIQNSRRRSKGSCFYGSETCSRNCRKQCRRII